MSGAGHRIRRLEAGDAEIFRSIRLEALERHPGAFGASLADEAAQPLAFFAGRLESGPVFGGFAGSALLGVAGFYVLQGEKQQHRGTLWGMYVREPARGSGLATTLVERVVRHARMCVEQIHLTCGETNLPARRLYERAGFAVCGREPRSLKIDGRYFDAVQMVRLFDDEGPAIKGGAGR